LFEDNAEFGLGMRLGLDAKGALALELLDDLADDHEVRRGAYPTHWFEE
jgi:hypothetical protein